MGSNVKNSWSRRLKSGRQRNRELKEIETVLQNTDLKGRQRVEVLKRRLELQEADNGSPQIWLSVLGMSLTIGSLAPALIAGIANPDGDDTSFLPILVVTIAAFAVGGLTASGRSLLIRRRELRRQAQQDTAKARIGREIEAYFSLLQEQDDRPQWPSLAAEPAEVAS